MRSRITDLRATTRTGGRAARSGFTHPISSSAETSPTTIAARACGPTSTTSIPSTRTTASKTTNGAESFTRSAMTPSSARTRPAEMALEKATRIGRRAPASRSSRHGMSQVYGNVVEDNWQGITGLNDHRGTGNAGPWTLTNLYVHDNIVTSRVEDAGGGRSGIIDTKGTNAFSAGANNRFRQNTLFPRKKAPILFLDGQRTGRNRMASIRPGRIRNGSALTMNVSAVAARKVSRRSSSPISANCRRR